MTSLKNVTSKSFFSFFECFKLLSMCAKFQVNKQQFSIQKKKYDGDNFTPSPRKQLRGQKTSVRIGLIKLTELSDTRYIGIFWYIELQAIFETLHFTNYFTRIFIVYICVRQNLLFCKLSYIFHFFDLDWVGIRCYSINGFVLVVLFL